MEEDKPILFPKATTVPSKPEKFRHVIFDANGNTSPNIPIVIPINELRYFLADQFPTSKTRPHGWNTLAKVFWILSQFMKLRTFELWVHGLYTQDLVNPSLIQMTAFVCVEELDGLSPEDKELIGAFLISSRGPAHETSRLRKIMEKHQMSLEMFACVKDPNHPCYEISKSMYNRMRKGLLRDPYAKPTGYFVCRSEGPIYP